MKFRTHYFVLTISICSLAACAQNTKPAEVPLAVESVQGIAMTVNSEEFAKLIAEKKDATILDVRTDEEIAQGCIAGQKQMNFYDETFQEKLSTLDKNKPVLVYCKAAGRSTKAMNMMSEMGFKEVYNLDGGFDSWQASGMPVSKN